MPDDPNKPKDASTGGFLSNLTPSPGVEEFLSAIPLILGSYEEARGKPIGAAGSALGQLLMMHGMDRSKLAKKQQGVQSLLKLVQGLDPKKAPVVSQLMQQAAPEIGTMEPDAATKLLNNYLSQGVKEEEASMKAAKPQIRQTANHNPYVVNLGATDPSQRVTDLYGNPISPSQLAHMERGDPKTEMAAEIQAFKDSNPNASSADLSKYLYNYDLNKAQQKALQSTQLRIQADAINRSAAFNNSLKLKEIDLKMAPYKAQMLADIKDKNTLTATALKGVDLLDNNPSSPTYLQVKRIPVYYDAKQALRDGSVIGVPVSLTNKIGHARSIIHMFDALDKAAAQVLPPGTKGKVPTYLQNLQIRLAQHLMVTSGDKDAAALLQDPNLMVAELGPLLSNSNRAIAVAEFTRFAGHDFGLGKKATSFLDAGDISAITPKLGVDTLETYNQKKEAILSIVKHQLEENSINLPEETGGPLVTAPSAPPGEIKFEPAK